MKVKYNSKKICFVVCIWYIPQITIIDRTIRESKSLDACIYLLKCRNAEYILGEGVSYYWINILLEVLTTIRLGTNLEFLESSENRT